MFNRKEKVAPSLPYNEDDTPFSVRHLHVHIVLAKCCVSKAGFYICSSEVNSGYKLKKSNDKRYPVHVYVVNTPINMSCFITTMLIMETLTPFVSPAMQNVENK